MHRYNELRHPVSDVMVQAAAPALLVTESSIVEGSDIAVRWHTRSVAEEPATEDATARQAPLPPVIECPPGLSYGRDGLE
jgi:hypothetical protein